MAGPAPSQEKADRKAAIWTIFRDQLAELERERPMVHCWQPISEQAGRKLQKRLLEEVDDAGVAAKPPAMPLSRPLAIGLLLLIPVAALVGYPYSAIRSRLTSPNRRRRK